MALVASARGARCETHGARDAMSRELRLKNEDRSRLYLAQNVGGVSMTLSAPPAVPVAQSHCSQHRPASNPK
jgi:hypothetical protein